MVIILDEDLSPASFLIVLNKLDDEEEREINGRRNTVGVRDRVDDKSNHDDRDHSRVDFTEGIAIPARGAGGHKEKGTNEDEGEPL